MTNVWNVKKYGANAGLSSRRLFLSKFVFQMVRDIWKKKKKNLNNNTLDLIVLHFGIAFHETLTLTVACYFRGTDFYDEIVIN